MPSTAKLEAVGGKLEWVDDRMSSRMGWVGKERIAKGDAKPGSK